MKCGEPVTIRHLRLFIEVYKTCNITKAAENLHIAQPSVTRAIREIEDYYGVVLFERINRKLVVNDAGNRFYRYALQAVESFDMLEQEMHSWPDNSIIRIGSNLTLGDTLLPDLVKRFKSIRPHTRVKTLICNQKMLQQAVLDNRLDFAFVEGTFSGEQFHMEPLARSKFVLLLPPTHPLLAKETLCLQDLAHCDFLLRETGSIGRRFVDEMLASHGFPIEPLMESASTTALVKAVHEGLGVAILPEKMVSASIESGYVATRELEDVRLFQTQYIVWLEGKIISERMQELMALSKEMVLM